MIRIKTITLLLVLGISLQAQENYTLFLQSVEVQNRTLSSAMKLVDSEVLQASTGIYLPNPEISYDYLTGSDIDYSEMVISQAFDFPTSYIHKSQIAELAEEQAKMKYRQTKIRIMTEATQLYTRQVIMNSKLSMLTQMNDMLDQMLQNARKKLEVGDINILELNRIRSEAARNKVEIELLKNQDVQLKGKISEINGGVPYIIPDSVFNFELLNDHPDSLLSLLVENHPSKIFYSNMIQLTEKEIQLQRSSSLPKFELGYRQDMNSLESHKGLHAGMSIPLFENKNTVRHARAQQLYVLEKNEAESLALENELRNLISQYSTSRQSLAEIELEMEHLHIPALLLKSYESGQIAYTEFFTEYSNFRDTQLFIEELRQKVVELNFRLMVLKYY